MPDTSERGHFGLADQLRANREALGRPAGQWAKLKGEWLEDLQKLYDHLRNWLSYLEKEGLVVIHVSQSHVVEPGLGRYVAPHLQLHFPHERKIVTVTTGGMGTFDTTGVVTVSAGPDREVALVRTPDRRWVYIQRGIHHGSHRGPDEMVNVTHELFERVLQDLLA